MIHGYSNHGHVTSRCHHLLVAHINLAGAQGITEWKDVLVEGYEEWHDS